MSSTTTKSQSVNPPNRIRHDPIWHLQAGVLAVIVLQVATSHSFIPTNKVALIALEVILLFGLSIITPNGYHKVSRARRTIAISLIAIATVANIFSLISLIVALVTGGTDLTGVELLLNAVAIFVTNMFLFALWYWEMDGGGPDGRLHKKKARDFLFPQMVHSNLTEDHWKPGFTDYLYLSATNVTNFASADTLPLSHRAKMMMMVQSLASATTVVLVVARAISIMQ